MLYHVFQCFLFSGFGFFLRLQDKSKISCLVLDPLHPSVFKDSKLTSCQILTNLQTLRKRGSPRSCSCLYSQRWFMISYQSLIDLRITSSNLTIFILFDKNQAQGSIGLWTLLTQWSRVKISLSLFYLIKIKYKIVLVCTSFKPKVFTLEGVLESNINHIMEPSF